MMITISNISKAISDRFPSTGSEFWLDRNGEEAELVAEATRRGYIRRLSWTQAQWTESGLEKARAEIPA